jgi:DNA-binding transcriptional regulator GbsR (MarR family)
MTNLIFRRFLSAARNVLIFNEAKWSPEILEAARQSCSVCENFITEEEERNLLDEIEPHMKRLKYEKDHWDDAIYLYR